MDFLETKADFTVTDAGEITGIAWPFGSPDRVGDVIEKGSFTSPASLPMLFAHDQSQVIGVWDSITETTQGLIVKGRLLVDQIARAAEVRAMIRANAATGLSIGFVTKQAKSRKGGGRTISALNLHEISVVAVPCHPAAQITSIKAADGTATDKENTMENELENEQPEAKSAPVIDQKAFDAMKARLDKLEAKSNRPKADNNNHPTASNDNEERKAFGDFLRTGRMEEKTLSYGASTAVVLAPEETAASIIEKIAEFSPVRQIAASMSMSGPLLQLPRLVNEVQVGDVGETGDRPESEPSFEQIDLKPFEMAVVVPVTRTLLEDAQINLEAYLANHVARRFGQKEAAWFVNGNGTTQAEGFLKSAEFAPLETDVIDADALIDAFYKIASAYSANGSWLMNRGTMAVIRKLKDTDGSYLWQPSIAAGVPPTLLGRPVLEAVDMPAIGANAVPIAFGDFASAYTIADRVGFETYRDEANSFLNGIVKLSARRRVGGRVTLGEALTGLKIAA
ncbi:phage major capsid protein [Phyllobacterium zundukense]|uniref:Phage major capsid protein n=1 Tax=Phyllobacterium zundukense TaxID=1867719 RepID=A0ACD4D7E7_9HYPH|nr:phage major capsid protein [Phyllobacterium zundukense]UXN61726.1 phage major capsid protein [Phyllobacterium zundukense]